MTPEHEHVRQNLEAAAGRFAAMLTARGAEDAVAAALADECVLTHFGNFEERGQVVKRLEGAAAIAAWAGTSPEATTFALASPVTLDADGETGIVRYLVTASFGFRNHGEWRLRLAPDGRVAAVSHQPDELPGAHRHRH